MNMDISDDEIDCSANTEAKFVNEIIKAVLILDHSKKPFKQSDITGFLSSKPSRKMWSSIFVQTKKKLKEMGLELLETKSTSSKSFFLTSDLFPLPSMYKYAPENEVADRTLLILVLTFIFMRERPVSDVDILNHLQQLKIYNSEKPVHEYFGDVKKKIFIEFVSQLYLERIIDKESDTIQIKWGERANAEVTKRSVLEFACKVGYQGTIKPENLVSHYLNVVEEEKEKSQTPD